MRRCEDVRPEITLLAGGDLARAEAEALRSHLDECAECSRQLSDELWSRRALQRAIPADAVPEFLPEVGDAFFEDLHQAVVRRVVGASRPRVRRWRAAAAAAAILVGFAVSFGPKIIPESPNRLPVLDRPALAFPAADAVWGETRSTRPLGRLGTGSHGLGGRASAAELSGLDRVDRELDDELDPTRRR